MKKQEIDEVEEYEEETNDDTKLKKHINLLFIGHVDAGKSTLCGHIMYLTGNVDSRTLEKFEHEAKAHGRESWKYAWAMDITENERLKGKTEECGVAVFNTENKRYTIIDAPGHKNYVPHMIGGASQADVAVLVISSRKGEFEAGFDKSGQTREHVLLARTAGVRQLIVAVTKMDDSSVEWKQERFDEIVKKLTPYLKQVGYGPNDVTWIPISGFQGHNIRETVPKTLCAWYDGVSLLKCLDEMKQPERLFGRPVRLPIIGKYKNRGTMAMGKLESGTIKVGDKLIMMPNKQNVSVEKIYLETSSLEIAEPGDNIRVQLSGIEEDEISIGFILCSLDSHIPIVKKFKANVNILEYKTIICSGFSCVMHIHSIVQEVKIDDIVAVVDKKTKKVVKDHPKFVKSNESIIATFVLESACCIETYKDFQQLGRFMLRDEGKTIAVGVVTDLLTIE